MSLFLSLLIGILCLARSSSASAPGHLLAQEFKNLPRTKQIRFLKALQRYLVQIDYRDYQKRFPNSTYWKNFLNNFDSRAYAQETGNEENEKVPQTSKVCLYGGFYSEMAGEYCTHPLRSSFASEYREACNVFEKEEQKAKCLKDDLKLNVCNPLIFGKKRAEEFFNKVNAGSEYSKFTTYNCLVNARTGDEQENLGAILENILNNSLDDFAKLLEHIFQLCLCPSGQQVQLVDQSFKDRHFGSNTCMALLYQIQSLLNVEKNSCESFSSDQNENLKDIQETLASVLESSLDKFEEYLSKKELKYNVINEKLSEYEKQFSEFLSNDSKNVLLNNYCSFEANLNKIREKKEEVVAEQAEEVDAEEPKSCLESLTMDISNTCDDDKTLLECDVVVTLELEEKELCKKKVKDMKIQYALTTKDHPFEKEIKNQKGETSSEASNKFNRVFLKDYSIEFVLKDKDEKLKKSATIPFLIQTGGDNGARQLFLKGKN
ncbi:MAG: hypothetical protein H6621_01605 [Halobacteriovoraceae bacterium]|nr:hypothetical protein [Halobacteriovoraceae bacterium]